MANDQKSTLATKMVTECFTSFAGGRTRFKKITRYASRLAARGKAPRRLYAVHVRLVSDSEA